jgi:hypothetical protein
MMMRAARMLSSKCAENPAMHVRQATVVIEPTPILQPRDKKAYHA